MAGGSCKDKEGWARQTIAAQLAPWNRTGINVRLFQGASRYQPRVNGLSHLQVQNGTVNAENAWGYYMKRAATNWPFPKSELRDFMIVGEDADWPFMMKGDPNADPKNAGPALTNANNGNFWNILMPVQSRPQHMDDFMGKRETALKLGKKIAWKDRKDIAVWRGSLGCTQGCGHRGPAYFPNAVIKSCRDDSPHWDPNVVGIVYGCAEDKKTNTGGWMRHYRVQLARQTIACGDVCGLDAKFAGIGTEHRPFFQNYTGQEGLAVWIGGGMKDPITAEHRYVFHVGNNGFADRSWRMFALGCVVLMVENGWQEWYFSLLKPWVHFIPIKEDSSDVCEKLQWARAHPEEAEAIAARGRAFIETCFDVDLVNLYVAELMRQLGELWALGQEPQNS